MTTAGAIEFKRQTASGAEILRHLIACDSSYTPPLSERVRLPDYAEKLSARALLFEAWHGDALVGLVAAYAPPSPAPFFISNVSVDPRFGGRSIATTLMRQCICAARESNSSGLELEVSLFNRRARDLYGRLGFIPGTRTDTHLSMALHLTSEST